MKNVKLTLIAISFFTISCASDSTSDVEENTNNITYSNTIQPIMSQSCATSACHDSNAPAAGLSLTTFAEVKDAFQNNDPLARIESGNMPKNANKLSASTIANIKTWIADNYPQ